MPSQFFGLNTAYKGLLASNAALNTTSNNISNVQTKGYSRQQVVQQVLVLIWEQVQVLMQVHRVAAHHMAMML